MKQTILKTLSQQNQTITLEKSPRQYTYTHPKTKPQHKITQPRIPQPPPTVRNYLTIQQKPHTPSVTKIGINEHNTLYEQKRGIAPAKLPTQQINHFQTDTFDPKISNQPPGTNEVDDPNDRKPAAIPGKTSPKIIQNPYHKIFNTQPCIPHKLSTTAYLSKQPTPTTQHQPQHPHIPPHPTTNHHTSTTTKNASTRTTKAIKAQTINKKYTKRKHKLPTLNINHPNKKSHNKITK
jgi:hypothetical protein